MQSTLSPTVITEILSEEVDDKTTKDYEKLNDRCDQVIVKIRERKNKKNKKIK